MRLKAKMLFIGELVLLLAVLAMFVPVRLSMRRQVVEDMQSRLSAIAATAALQMDGDLHSAICESDHTSGVAFTALRDRLRAVMQANDLEPDNIYSMCRHGDTLHFAVMTHVDSFIGDSYPMRAEMTAVFKQGEVVTTDLYKDEYGTWISAYAPIRNSAGEVVGILDVNQRSDAYFARYEMLTRLAGGLALFTLLSTSILGFFVLDRLIISPMRALRDGMTALARHDFRHRVRVATNDEFQDLGETLNNLSTQFDVARLIQNSFFPDDLPRHQSFRLAARSEPADATGGDYYDAFVIDEDRIAVLIADVSGHGIGASLLMATCRAAVHALADETITPSGMIIRLNRLLAEDLEEGRFITMLLGIADRRGTFTYANAGHGPALFVGSNGAKELVTHTPPLGVLPDLESDDAGQETIDLEPGDRIFLASDGLSEAMNPWGSRFGLERILQVVTNRHLDCHQVILRLEDRLGVHTDGRSPVDDVTILCLDYRGHESEQSAPTEERQDQHPQQSLHPLS